MLSLHFHFITFVRNVTNKNAEEMPETQKQNSRTYKKAQTHIVIFVYTLIVFTHTKNKHYRERWPTYSLIYTLI